MAALIREHNWSSARLGPPDTWPAHLKITTSLLLRCPLAMAVLWGDDGILIYNDAYAALSGSKHPSLLGKPAREAWSEVAGFVDHLMGTCLAGEALSYREHDLVLERDGQPERMWLNLDYWALLDAEGQPAGVMAVVIDATDKVIAQRRLNGERERFSQLFDQSPSFMAMLEGPEHRFALVNPNYVSLIGHRDVLGRTMAESLPDVASQGYVSVLDEVYRSGQTFRADGAEYGQQIEIGGPVQMRHLDFVLQPVRDQDDCISGVCVEGVDVTERHRAQEELAKALRRQKLLFDIVLQQRSSHSASEVMHVAAVMTGTFFDAGRADFYRLTDDDTLRFEQGWRPDELSPANETWIGEDLGGVRQLLRAGETLVFDDAVSDPRLSGSIFPHVGMMSGVGVPIVRDGLWLAGFNLGSRSLRTWSPDDIELIQEVAQLTWDAVERISGKLDLELANRGLQERVAEALREQAKAELTLRNAQRMESVRLRSANELLTAANRELALSRDAAQAASRAKGAFLANMSHEIRTPLNGILGLTHLLARDPRDKQQADRLALIGSSGQHLMQIVNDVLDLSKIEAGKLDLHETEFSLPVLLSTTIAMIEDSARSKGLRLIVEADDLPDRLTGDTTRISQILLNLLTNAVKFTDTGSVRLRCSAVAEPTDRVTIRIEVRDTGVGIAKESQGLLFTAFEQGDSTPTRRYGGTGLGLALTQKIVQAMGGDVGVESELGGGSTFWATIDIQRQPDVRLFEESSSEAPLRMASIVDPAELQGGVGDGVKFVRTGFAFARGSAPDDEATEGLLRAHHGQRRVLVAEDDAVNRIVVCELLDSLGLIVEIAENGAIALELALSRPYDLILMDVQMPEMDGLEATRRILMRNESAPPVIAMTAHAFLEDRVACLDAGMSDHVAKPVQPTDLYSKLSQWLPKSDAVHS